MVRSAFRGLVMARRVSLFLLAAYALALVALLVAVAWLHHKSRPCRATFEQVQVGMTLEEVEATVGGPPGEYGLEAHEVTPKEVLFDIKLSLPGPRRKGTEPGIISGGCWRTDDAGMKVTFQDGRVDEVYILDRSPAKWHIACERVWDRVTGKHDDSSSSRLCLRSDRIIFVRR